MNTPEVLNYYLEVKKVCTPQELADAIEVTKRQVDRYRSADNPQAPTLPIAIKMADRLGISVLELAGREPSQPRYSGTWWAANQSWKDGVERIDVSEVHITQDGDFLILESGRAQGDNALELGDYAWSAELRLDQPTSTLVGEWRSDDGAVRTRGAYYFKIHPQGEFMLGRWVGDDYDGPEVSGRMTLARNKEVAEKLLNEIKGIEGNVTTWPTTT